MITKAQARKLETLHAAMAPALERRYSIQNNQATDVAIAWVDQTLVSEFAASLTTPCHSYTFNFSPPGIRCVLDYPIPIRDEFKARSSMTKTEGPVTDTERSFMTPIVRQDLAALKAAWEPVEKIKVSDASIEQDPEQLGLGLPDELIVLAALECNMQKASGLIRIAYPIALVESLHPKLDAWGPG